MRLPKPLVEGRKTERMSNASFRIMVLFFDVIDFFYPHVAKRVTRFGIGEGMTVVDYGCGPGRYTIALAGLVGEKGKVYALDIHELAVETVKKRIAKRRLRDRYHCGGMCRRASPGRRSSPQASCVGKHSFAST